MHVRRLISASKSEIKKMNKEDLKKSILASEGRVILVQNFAYLGGGEVSNPELSQAYGADMIFLNGYSMDSKAEMPGLIIHEIDEETGEYVRKQYRLPDLRKLIDVPLGVYLECGAGDDVTTSTSNFNLVRPDRVASEENLLRLKEEGANFVVLAGNPGTGTSFDSIIEATKRAKKLIGDDILIFAGKWEDGVYQKVLGDPLADRPATDVIKDLIDAGADVICLPMPGSRTGITPDMIRKCVEFIHSYKPGTLAMNFLDGSVEGADEATVRACMLLSKQTGADIHAIGDAGGFGMPIPENIYQMSITCKGRRLTWKRIAGGRR